MSDVMENELRFAGAVRDAVTALPEKFRRPLMTAVEALLCAIPPEHTDAAQRAVATAFASAEPLTHAQRKNSVGFTRTGLVTTAQRTARGRGAKRTRMVEQ